VIKKLPKPKKKGTIQIRVLPEEKDEWQEYVKLHKKEFPSLSQLIRFAVGEVMEKGITTTIKNGENTQNKLHQTNSLIKALSEERKELLEIVRDKMKANNKSKDVSIEHDIKGKILKWITKFNGKLDLESIADLINTPEPKTLEYLNKLVAQNLITFNKKMQYEVVNNE